MGSIKKRGPLSFQLTIELGYDANGKRLQKTKTIRIDEQIAQSVRKLNSFFLRQELLKFQTEVERGEFIGLEKMTFAEFVEIGVRNSWRRNLKR